MISLGERIRIERMRKRLSQEELAVQLGFKRTNVANYEANRVTPPSDAIAKLSKIFGVSTDFLLGLDDTDLGIGDAIKEEIEEQNIKVAELAASVGAYPSEIRACIDEGLPISETILNRIVEHFGLTLLEFLDKHGLYDEHIPPHFSGSPDAYFAFHKARERDAMADKIETIAAHHDGEDWTEEELEEIKRFKEFVKMKRGHRTGE